MIILGRAEETELLNMLGERRGSVVSYFGYVRSEAGGRKVSEMHCEMREESRSIMEEIERKIRARYPVEEVILYHSLGTLKPGELIAGVLVSSVHRAEGFEACRYGIDRIKELEPVKRTDIFVD